MALTDQRVDRPARVWLGATLLTKTDASPDPLAVGTRAPHARIFPDVSAEMYMVSLHGPRFLKTFWFPIFFFFVCLVHGHGMGVLSPASLQFDLLTTYLYVRIYVCCWMACSCAG